eukprot:187181_1
MSLVVKEEEYQHILRILNTNVEGGKPAPIALTKIRGIGKRFATLICRKAEIDIRKRAGEMTQEEIEKVKAIIQNPRQYNIPDWFLNRRKDMQTGKPLHLHAHQLAAKFREDLQKWKKTRRHRGLRHHWGLKVRGQHTKTNGHGNRTVGYQAKK